VLDGHRQRFVRNLEQPDHGPVRLHNDASGVGNFLDYPDVAGIACPKPMMFLCGRRDALFPVAAIEEALDKMRRVWESQPGGAKLKTRRYDAPHEFNATMPDEASASLEVRLQPTKWSRRRTFCSGTGGRRGTTPPRRRSAIPSS